MHKKCANLWIRSKGLENDSLWRNKIENPDHEGLNPDLQGLKRLKNTPFLNPWRSGWILGKNMGLSPRVLKLYALCFNLAHAALTQNLLKSLKTESSLRPPPKYIYIYIYMLYITDWMLFKVKQQLKWRLGGQPYMYTYLLINTRDQNTSIDVTENSNVITQFKIFHRTFVIFSRASQTEVMEEGCWKKLPSSVQILNPPVNNLLFRLSIGRSDRKSASVQRKYKLVQRGQECWLNYQSDVSVLALRVRQNTISSQLGSWNWVEHKNATWIFGVWGVCTLLQIIDSVEFKLLVAAAFLIYQRLL